MQTYKLLSNDSVLLSQPKLIEEFGRAGAHFISQLHYWLTKDTKIGSLHSGVRWIYNSAKDWSQQISISERQMERIISKLLTIGVVQSKRLSKNKFDRTNHYTINYDALNCLIASTTPLETAENSRPTLRRNRNRQNDVISIQKLPNKDFNKSESVQSFRGGGEGEGIDSDQVTQVKQVSDLNLKNAESPQIYLEKTPQNPKQNNEFVNIKTITVAKNSTVQEMLKIWNENFQDKAKTKLTKDLAPLLVAAFKQKFANSLKGWGEYCQQIKSSPYLMGDAFNLNISWALKFFTIERIRAGELGVKSPEMIVEREPNLDKIHSEQQVEQMIETLDESQSAKALRQKIMQAIGHQAYFSWFHQAEFCEKDGAIRLIAPNKFVAQYWETHFEWITKQGSINKS